MAGLPMRSNIAFVLGLFVVIIATTSTQAEGVPAYLSLSENPDTVTEPSSLFDQSPHPGLLGKGFLSASYVYADFGDRGILDQTHGFNVTLNVPLIQGDGTKTLALDAFTNYMMLFANDDFTFFGDRFEAELKGSEIGVGLTFYSEALDRIRPFAQVGWTFYSLRFDVTSQLMGTRKSRESDDDVLLNLGAEVDLTNRLAFRGLLEFDTGEFGDSVLRGELIISPNEKTFLRLGGFGQINSDVVGFTAGAGLKF